MRKSLRIESTPPGEAPLWVREKWLGLTLPLARGYEHPRTWLTSGVLSGPKGFVSRLVALVTGRLTRRSGYMVESSAAVAILATKSPDAAAWWRKNTPRLLRPGRYFLFPAEVGRVVDAPHEP